MKTLRISLLVYITLFCGSSHCQEADSSAIAQNQLDTILKTVSHDCPFSISPRYILFTPRDNLKHAIKTYTQKNPKELVTKQLKDEIYQTNDQFIVLACVSILISTDRESALPILEKYKQSFATTKVKWSRPWPRNFLSVKVFRMDLEADFKRLFVVGFGC